MSDFAPPRAAMMKSAGEQSAGHAAWQGFSSHEMHRFNSSLSWASVRKGWAVFMPSALTGNGLVSILSPSRSRLYPGLAEGYAYFVRKGRED
jgi:hypothetical protein